MTKANARTRQGPTGRSSSALAEHAYRLAMVRVGGALWPLRLLQATFGRGHEAICLVRKPELEEAR